ncbi:MAG: heme-binding protein [Gammaproteobacteria bacterium]|nr:heme-binding protein [Gammaproteobacteria bacterium]
MKGKEVIMGNSMVGYIISFFVIVVSLTLVFKGSFWLFREVETPNYLVISKHKNMEVRQYPIMIRASLEQKGARPEAISMGFSKLAAYIFGKNDAHKKIKMTAPVLQETLKDGWKIQFIMPAYLLMDEIPKPFDNDIQLIESDEERMAVIRFSGRIKESRLEHFTAHLQQFLQSQGCKTQSSAIYAFYNPPWTIPFMRRNEVWFRVANDCRF